MLNVNMAKEYGMQKVGKRHDPELSDPPVTAKNIDANNPNAITAISAVTAEYLPPVTAKPVKKIAIMGTAPQWQLAPFDDPSWEIWGIFGLVGCGKRLDKVFEIHDRSIIEPMAEKDPAKKYWEFVNSLGDKFITKDHFDKAPSARRFDFASKMKKYGDYFASSASWLVAEAIDQGATTIGLWGINMASDSEYAHQKPSLSYMLGWARCLGISVEIPASSELLAVTHQYGLDAEPRFITTLKQKKAEVEQALATHKNNFSASQMGVYGTEQALGILKWIEQNYSGG